MIEAVFTFGGGIVQKGAYSVSSLANGFTWIFKSNVDGREYTGCVVSRMDEVFPDFKSWGGCFLENAFEQLNLFGADE